MDHHFLKTIIRLSAGDLQDIQVRASEEGMPYRTLIASVLHKHVTGRLAERAPEGMSAAPRATRRTSRSDAQPLHRDLSARQRVSVLRISAWPSLVFSCLLDALVAGATIEGLHVAVGEIGIGRPRCGPRV